MDARPLETSLACILIGLHMAFVTHFSGELLRAILAIIAAAALCISITPYTIAKNTHSIHFVTRYWLASCIAVSAVIIGFNWSAFVYRHTDTLSVRSYFLIAALCDFAIEGAFAGIAVICAIITLFSPVSGIAVAAL